MSESANVIAWEEGEPAAALLAPEQAMTAVVSSRLGQVFFLTEDGRVYLSTLKQDGLSGKLQELALPCQTVVGIACNSVHTIFVTDRGRVLRSELETPEKVEELAIKQPNLCCPHGVVEDGGRLFVREVSSHSKNVLFISDSSKIWAVDETKSLLPDKLPAFENKVPISIMCGTNFSVALVQDFENPTDSISKSNTSIKSNWDSLDGVNISKGGPFDGLCVVGSCLECREHSLLSLHSLDLNTSQRINQEDFKDNVNSLAQVCWSKADHLVRQSALLLNSTPQLGAAKQFLTKQLSWVTGFEADDCNNSLAASSTLDSGNNVTQQVASRVAEGVRNLGDAVNRMSRHWSGTSQEEAALQVAATPLEVSATTETSSLPAELLSSSSGEDSPAAPATPRFIVRQSLQSHHRWKRNGSSSLSLDSTLLRITDREKMTGLQPERLVSLGRQLLHTSVWAWGQGGVGQLGLSDCVSRETPTSVRHLLGIGVCKVACGSRHSLALTLDGRVLAWGANNKGQVEPGEDLSFMSIPIEVSLPFHATIRDIAAGREHTLLLTSHGEVLFMGFSMATQKSTIMRLNLPAQSPNGKPSRVWATGPLSCCLLCNQSCRCWPHWSEFVLSEQLFLRNCLKVARGILDQLESSTTNSAVRRELFDRYRDLMACTAVNVHSLIETDDCANLSIGLVRWINEYMHVWRSYGQALCNATVVHSLVLSKSENALLDPEIFPQVRRPGSDNFATLMNEPLGRLKEYSIHLENLIESHRQRNDKNMDRYKYASQRCLDMAATLMQECRTADLTKAFWDSCSAKLTDTLRTPVRRLIRESRSHPIGLVNSGRFSSHWFIILTDVLVHVSGSSSHVTYPLATIWVEPMQESENVQIKNGLSLTMPEESMTLTCPTSADKIEWLVALQSAIKQALLIGDVESNSNGRTTPPLVRSASYTFTKLPHLKDVTYKGAWLCGKMHGEGELHWPDGRVYRGSFRQNQQYGFGSSESFGPNGTTYEGSWKDGKMNGYGILKYANGDVYEGNFQDGQPHGHGTLKRGHFLTSAAHVYVGQWESGQKNGYGVMDDIVTGEKYMGMWQADARHGQAVLVTLDGLYIEGSFTNNKMTGQCVMLLEDGTSYEGEVAGVGILGGKGLLQFPNGDIIQGTFHGSWSDGIKINATLTKASLSAQSPLGPPTGLSMGHLQQQHGSGVPAERKWGAIFHQCCLTLGLSPDCAQWTSDDSLRAWDQIAAVLNQSKQRTTNDNQLRPKIHHHRRQGSSVSSKSVKSERLTSTQPVNVEIPEILQHIPDYGRNQLNGDEFIRIEAYLHMALESEIHPLGKLASQIGDVYRATYVGVGAHPRLLPHAVAEVHSFVSRLYAFVRLLFPALPEDRTVHLIPNEPSSGYQELQAVVSANTLLLPLLLPRLYPPLYTLYVLHNQKLDDLYWERLQKWNRQSDSALMNFLGVDQKFFIEEIAPDGSHFPTAVDCLQQLSTTFSPGQKLRVIHQTFQEVSRSVQTHLGADYVMNMDDLFPVFLFVVVRSRIRHLGTEIHLIEDFIDKHVQNGELDVMFTTLEASYQYIQHEKMTFN